jgi:hypothetical protein
MVEEQCMELRIVPLFQFRSPLQRYEGNITSQSGEDGLIAHIVKTIVPEHKYCVEFGAWDGMKFSNCHSLVKAHGWGGLMIEANPEKFEELKETYSGVQNVTLANRFVDFEGANTLDNILTEHGTPKSFGLISIDIDGADYYIWESLKDHTPEIVVIEINPTVPNDVVFIQDKSFDINQGCSLTAVILLGKEKGYELAVCTLYNAIFVRADKFPLLGIERNSIHNLYAPVQNGRIFQCMDGTIHVVGFDYLVWRGGQPVSSADFQIIPENQRGWGDAVTRKK